MTTEIGPHRLTCRSIVDGFGDVLNKADLIISYPPWHDGNICYWETMREKMVGAESPHVSYLDFPHALFSTFARHRAGPVVLSYGLRWVDDVIRFAEEYGMTHQATAAAFYGSQSKPESDFPELRCRWFGGGHGFFRGGMGGGNGMKFRHEMPSEPISVSTSF